MSEDLKIVAKPRDVRGTTEARRLRRDGWFPAVIYSDGKDGELIQLDEHVFTQILRHHHSESLMVDLEIEGKDSKKVLLKDVQHHAVTGTIVHADFHAISMTKKIKVGITLELVGDSIGVTQDGGVLEHPVREVEIECLPTDLTEHIDVDVTALNIGDVMLAGDIKLDTSKFTLITDPSVAIASVSAPRVEAEPTTEGEEAAVEGDEPEVITEKAEAAEGGAEKSE